MDQPNQDEIAFIRRELNPRANFFETLKKAPYVEAQPVRTISVADVAWVAAAAALLLGLPGVLVPSGRYIVLGVALVVLGFGMWQWWASRTAQAR